MKGRPREPHLRAALREKVIDYVLANGLAGLALRPLAEAVGSSARMLIYHFGSRERLLVEVLAGVREREDALIERWWNARGPARTLPGFIRWYWPRMTSNEAMPIIRLIFEIYAMALRSPRRLPGVLVDPLDYWRRLTRRSEGLKDRRIDATATLVLGATRGLLVDLLATGDRARVDSAVEKLARSLEPPARRRI